MIMRNVGLWVLATSMASLSADAAKIYQYGGKVTAMGTDSVSVRRNGETLEFDRASIQSSTRNIKVGDQVTVWYRLDAQKMRPRTLPLQAPGQLIDKSLFEEKGIIKDDRAFYDARNLRRDDASSQKPNG